MAVLRVLVAGARTTVQDLGFRQGRGQGVPACGVLDPDGLRLVNALLGNPPDTEALEVALLPPRFRVEAGPVRVALGGGLHGSVLAPGGTRRPLDPWTATTLDSGDELHLASPARGGTGLVGLRGGLDLPRVLDSRSTCLRAGFGGMAGRALREGDLLHLREPAVPAGLPDLHLTRPPPCDAGPIRIVPGPQADWFTPAEFARFLAGPYVLSPRCDRMGLRLDGPALGFAPGRGGDIISDGISPGAIQVPGNGLPIVLLADAQTTGGYPKIATVIRADLARLAALVPGDPIRLAAVTVGQAEALARAGRAALDRAIDSIAPVADAGTASLALLGASLIGGVVDMQRPDHFPGHLYRSDEDPEPCA